jgi:hypothetical protein
MTWSIKKCVGLIACAAAVLGMARPASADCSKESMKGAYSFSISGTNFIHDVPWGFVGRFESDGAGALTGRGVQSAKGQISRPEFKGTYQVEADCTGSGVLTFPAFSANLYFVVADNGKRVDMIIVDPGVLEHGSATRIADTVTTKTSASPR